MTFSIAVFPHPSATCSAFQDRRFKFDFLWKLSCMSKYYCFFFWCRKWCFKVDDVLYINAFLSSFSGFASVPVKGSCCSYSSLSWAFQTQCSISAPWNVTVEQCRQSSFFNTCKSWVGLKLLSLVNRRRKENFAWERYSHENLCKIIFCIYSSYISPKIIVATAAFDRRWVYYLLIASNGFIYATVNPSNIHHWVEGENTFPSVS